MPYCVDFLLVLKTVSGIGGLNFIRLLNSLTFSLNFFIEGLSFDFDPEEFLTWGAAAAGERLGVDYGVMFEVIGI